MTLSSLALAAALAATPVEPPPAAAEAAAGVETYRVFFTNGYGRKEPTVVAFERRPGDEPKAVVYTLDGKLERPVTEATWRMVQEDSRFADRKLVPLPPVKEGSEFVDSVTICSHPWGVVMELINSPLSPARAVRSAQQNTCHAGLTTQFGFELARLAVEQFPACAALDPEDHRNDVTLLAECARLTGDKIAAASLANQLIHPFQMPTDSPEFWNRWMGRNAQPELNWSGQIIKDAARGENSVGKFLAAQDERWILHLDPNRFEGVDARNAKVTGVFTRLKTLDDPERDIEEQADYEQVWTFDNSDDGWQLMTWRVGIFSPRPEPVKK